MPNSSEKFSRQQFRQVLLETAGKVGIDLVGICGPEKFSEAEAVLAQLGQAGYCAPFTVSCHEERTDPKRVFPGVKSIIAVGLAYKKPEKIEESRVTIQPGRNSGKFAHFAAGRDYHLVLREKINKLMEKWQQAIGQEVHWVAQVDNGVLPDRAVAWRAGLGWYGQNCNLINQQFGSWLVLGEVLIDLELESDKPSETSCGDCGLCLQACPTGALESPYRLNAYRCISYLTQAPGYIPRDLRKAMGRQIYGCDLCQLICPHNAQAEAGNYQEFSCNTEAGASEPVLEDFLRLTNKEFKQLYAETAAGWRGKKLLQRNAVIALGNSGDPAVIPVLVEALQDVRPEIRGHAAWALAQYGGERVIEYLKATLTKEQDPEVRQELVLSLQELTLTDM